MPKLRIIGLGVFLFIYLFPWICYCEIDFTKWYTSDNPICPVLGLSFENWKLASPQLLTNVFPIDSELVNYVRQVRGAIFSKAIPTPFTSDARLVASSDDALISLLDLDPQIAGTKVFVDAFSGNRLLTGSHPVAHRYGGHQFGVWAGQLGDGRAHLLGERVNNRGERWELQLKGSGRTPYSRDGDGRAVVRSSVREFLASEAMHFLGVPTSRSVSLIISNDTVKRDPLYRGDVINEKTAVVLRLAPSWFRFGSFEILAKHNELELLRKLSDFVIRMHYESIDPVDTERYLKLFSTVVDETANMIARWQSVGFAHGVCNTDNFSILSITIDYGPFQFMDVYDPNTIPNTSDDEGRYSFKNQPSVGRYNLEKLSLAIGAMLTPSQQKVLTYILDGYDQVYATAVIAAFKRKLGLVRGDESDDEILIENYLQMMADAKSDFTMTFRQLGECTVSELFIGCNSSNFWALKGLRGHANFYKWLDRYKDRLERYQISDAERRRLMMSVNPRYVLKNWIAQQAIEQVEKGNYSVIRKLLEILRNPFDNDDLAEQMGYANPPPSWSSNLRVSCSS